MNLDKIEDETVKEEPTPDMSRRNTFVPPPALEEIEQDIENLEEGTLVPISKHLKLISLSNYLRILGRRTRRKRRRKGGNTSEQKAI